MKAGAETPATAALHSQSCEMAEEPAMKAGAETPATDFADTPVSHNEVGPAMKAGAETPATGAHASRSSTMRTTARNEGRSRNPGNG